MDLTSLTSAYCPERKRLEECDWKLVSTLHALTGQLMTSVVTAKPAIRGHFKTGQRTLAKT